STYSGDIEEDKINLIEEEKEINILANEQLYNIESEIFSKTQTINFYKKYNQKVKTKLIDNDSKNNKILIQQDIKAFCFKFDTFNCYLTWNCTKKINHEIAIKKWKNVQLLSKAKKNTFLLATLNALTRKE
ncbi:16526_t:CDS:1, partial [Gigaspora rosea]